MTSTPGPGPTLLKRYRDNDDSFTVCKAIRSQENTGLLYRYGFPEALICKARAITLELDPADPVIVPFLLRNGFTQATVDEWQREGLHVEAAKIVLADIKEIHANELIDISMYCSAQEIERSILVGEFVNLYHRLAPEDDSLAAFMAAESIKFIHAKRYLRKLGITESALHSSEESIKALFEVHKEKGQPGRQEALSCGLTEADLDALYISGHLDLFLKRFLLHKKDIQYLCKSGCDISKIKFALLKSYPASLTSFFFLELSVLGEEARQDVVAGTMKSRVKEWLREETTYDACKQKTFTDQQWPGFWIYQCRQFENRCLRLKKYLIINDLLAGATALKHQHKEMQAVPLDCTSRNISVMAYRNAEGKISLIWWSGQILGAQNYWLLGQGSFGQVQEGIDPSRMDRTALKLIKVSKTALAENYQKASQENAEKVLREIHNIPPGPGISGLVERPFAAFNKGDLVGYATKAYEGSLSKFAESYPLWPATYRQVYDGVLDLFKGLKYLKDEGIAHFDLKTENILFDYSTETGELKFALGDFGGARKIEEIEKFDHGCYSQTFHIPGELTYLRELSTSKTISHKAIASQTHSMDMFAMGKTLLELFIGRHVSSNKLSLGIEDLQKKGNHSPVIIDLISGLLQPKKRSRTSLEEALATLEAFLGDPANEEWLNAPFATFCKPKIPAAAPIGE